MESKIKYDDHLNLNKLNIFQSNEPKEHNKKIELEIIKKIKIDCSKYEHSKAKIKSGKYVIQKC